MPVVKDKDGRFLLITDKFRGNSFDAIPTEDGNIVFPFRSASGKKYLVRFFPKRRVCNCPAFFYHYDRQGCKHIDFVLDHQEYWKDLRLRIL